MAGTGTKTAQTAQKASKSEMEARLQAAIVRGVAARLAAAKRA